MIRTQKSVRSRMHIPLLIAVLVFGFGMRNALAQTTSGGIYIPLIGITSVPDPLALPGGAGAVTYHYAIKSFLQGVALVHVQVVDDSCNPVKYVTGDDNHDGKLDYSETWRYSCTTTISTTTQSTATATGVADGLTATHKAYATVIVGATTIPPLVSIVNITKVAYPLSLPAGGGSITFTYRVNNPGTVPLRDVTVTDDKCANMSGELGDRNGNQLLDPDEVWVYTCTTNLTQTTTNTATVTGYANGLKAIDYFTLTVEVANPGLPATGGHHNPNPTIPIVVWAILLGILLALVISFFVIRKSRPRSGHKRHHSSR